MPDPLREAIKRFERIQHKSKNFWREVSEEAKIARDLEEWKLLNYKSFDAYLEAACDSGRSQVYAGIRVIEQLSEMPKEVLDNLTLDNAKILSNIPAKERDAETVAVACTKSRTELVRHTKNHKPDLHLDFSETVSFKMHEAAQVIFWETVQACMKRYGLTAQGAAVERICADWNTGDVSIEQHEAARKLVVAVEDAVVVGEALPQPKAWSLVLQLAKRAGKIFNLKARELTVPAGSRVDLTSNGKQPRVQ